MKAHRPLCIFLAVAGASALAAACSQGAGGPESQASSPLDICVLDGAVCVDLPDVNIPPLPFDGGFPFDVNIPPFPDVALPPLPDAGFPSLPLPDGSFAFDAGAGNCDPLDPKYANEYAQQLQSGQTTPCGSCSATECCFVQLACVPQ
jgi:hypothetical protein